MNDANGEPEAPTTGQPARIKPEDLSLAEQRQMFLNMAQMQYQNTLKPVEIVEAGDLFFKYVMHGATPQSAPGNIIKPNFGSKAPAG